MHMYWEMRNIGFRWLRDSHIMRNIGRKSLRDSHIKKHWSRFGSNIRPIKGALQSWINLLLTIYQSVLALTKKEQQAMMTLQGMAENSFTSVYFFTNVFLGEIFFYPLNFWTKGITHKNFWTEAIKKKGR